MQKKKIHYAWVALIGSMIVAFCSIGLSANAFAAYQPYLMSCNGFTNSQSSFILTVRSLFTFLGMFLTGSFYKRISYRRGMALSCLVIALGFFLFGMARSYAFYLIAAAVLGIGYGFGSMIPAAIVIGRWFYKKRTFALSLCNAVTGAAMFGIPNLLTSGIEKLGLKNTFCLEAGCVVLLAVLSFVLIRNTPEEKGCAPYGADEGETEVRIRKQRGVMDRKSWWIMAPVTLLTGAVSTTAFIHFTVHAVSCGFSTQMASSGLLVLGICLSVGKILYGILAEKTSSYVANWASGACLILGSLLACFFDGKYPVLFFAGMAIYGLGFPLPTIGCSSWAADLSGEEDYAKNVRRFNTLNGAGNLIFSVVPGVLADRFGGSYVPAYIMFTVFGILVLLGVQSVYRRWMRENASDK